MIRGLADHFHKRWESPVTRWPAGLKLPVAILIIAVTVLLPVSVRPWFIGVGLFLGAIVLLSRIPILFLVKRLLLLSPLVLGVALVNALDPARHGAWTGVALKSGLCLLTVTLVSQTTPFSEILRILRRLRVPALLITTIALMHRYLFVMVEESERMRRARASRTFNRVKATQWQTLSTVLAQLFIRTSERAERIYDAMCARGWK